MDHDQRFKSLIKAFLPIVIYQRIGMQRIGVDSFELQFGPLRVLRFEYLYVGLPALDALEYLDVNVLAAAFVGLMRYPEEQAARLRADAAQRIAESQYNEQERYLLLECLEAYLTLEDPAQWAEYEQLMFGEEYEEAQTMTTTTYERGIQEGIEQGIEQGIVRERRRTLPLQIEAKFGPLDAVTRQRLVDMNADELDQIVRRILIAEALDELGLGNGAE